MAAIYIALGSNMGDRKRHLQLACEAVIDFLGSFKKASAIYQTAAWGNTEQQDFYNQVLCFESDLEAQEIMDECLMIEERLGRTRHTHWGPRTIDIDLLLYGDLILNKQRLKIPHPELTNRRFVLAPLAEIAGHVWHPVAQKDIASLLEACKDELPVDVLLEQPFQKMKE